MAHFTTNGKEYPSGDSLPSFGGTDLMVVAAGTTFAQTAPANLPDAGGKACDFLFWDTGRRLTGKRTVHWTFNHPGNWSEWKAVAWYGICPPGNDPTWTTNAFWVGSGPLAATPVDAAGSTFTNAPGGTPVAYPWGGNDHQVRTEFGPASIKAKSNMQKSLSDPQLDFSSWTALVPGGDSSSYCDENDDDITPSSGLFGVANTTSQVFAAKKGSGGLLLAGYVKPEKPSIDGGLLGKLQEVLVAISLGKYIDKGDPGPEDIIRLKLIAESLDLVRGEHPTASDAFEGLVSAAGKMTPTQLKRTITETRATLARGQAALKAIEGMARKGKGSR